MIRSACWANFIRRPVARLVTARSRFLMPPIATWEGMVTSGWKVEAVTRPGWK